MQPSLFPAPVPQTYTVSKLTFHILKLLEENEILQDVWVQGEISNLSPPASGHVYFTLKDANASLKCVMISWMIPSMMKRRGSGRLD